MATSAEQIIGAKAETRIFKMRGLSLDLLPPASLNSIVRLSDLFNGRFNVA